jgi:hypothetical protein
MLTCTLAFVAHLLAFIVLTLIVETYPVVPIVSIVPIVSLAPYCPCDSIVSDPYCLVPHIALNRTSTYCGTTLPVFAK